jgi:hypothetical protein
LSGGRGKKEGCESAAARAARRKRRNFTEEVYGARLPFEDARVLDDYARANSLDRSEVVRLGLHQFALRQQMLYHKKDPLRETLEQVVADQLAPVLRRADEMASILNDLACFVAERGRSLVVGVAQGDEGKPLQQVGKEAAATPDARVSAEYKQLLEQTLMAVMVSLRLQVNFLVEPLLSACEGRADGEGERQLRVAILGRDLWCETTRKVIARTGKRILFESNLISLEDWKDLLEGYRAEDERAGVR